MNGRAKTSVRRYRASLRWRIAAAIAIIVTVCLIDGSASVGAGARRERPLWRSTHARRPLAAAHADAVERGRQALAREGFPWYDAGEDAVRPVRVRPPKPVTSNPASTSTSSSSGSMSASQTISWLTIAAVFGVVLILLARAYLNRDTSPVGGARGPAKAPVANEAARIEALPFRLRPADHDLLAEARRQFESGHYDTAIVYLFSYQLVEMDKHQVLRLTKGKTNRQYLRDLRRQPRLSRIIEHSMVAFEEVFFGDRRLGRDAFESRWRALDEFHSIVRQQVAT